MTPTEMILRYFAHEHLPPELAAVSKPFCDLAQAKDCFVRAHLNEQKGDTP